MNFPFTRIAASLGLALLTSTAPAAIIEYDFTVTIDTAGSGLDGQSFIGSFSFDDADTPSQVFSGEDLYELKSFNFTFGSTPYALADLDNGYYAALDAVNGDFLGLDAVNSLFSFVPSTTDGLFPAAFNYDDLGSGDFGSGDVVFTKMSGNTVPEPGSLALGLLGLGLLAMSRRNR